MAGNTTLIDLHLEMFWRSIISACIKCDSFIYGRALRSWAQQKAGRDVVAGISPRVLRRRVLRGEFCRCRGPARLVAGPKPARSCPRPAGVKSIAPPTAVPKAANALPGAEVNAMPARVPSAVPAPKAPVPRAKAAMCAANASLAAATAVSSERSRGRQQCAGNRGRNSEFAYHSASPSGMTKLTLTKLFGR
jgi:hypothetical protein